MAKVQTEDQHYVRDTNSKGLLNTDRNSLMAARQRRRHHKGHEEFRMEIQQLRSDFDQLRQEFREFVAKHSSK
jgi:hypothetical protein